MSIDIHFNKVDKVYSPNEAISGFISVVSVSELYHSGISLVCEGSVNLQLSARSVGLFEAFYSSLKPITLVNINLNVVPSGNVQQGHKEYPFEFKLKSYDGKPLFESYHGVYVNIQYSITVEMVRGMMAKSLKKTVEFIVEIPTLDKVNFKQLNFDISPDTLQNVKQSSKSKVPEFLISGYLESDIFSVNRPLSGEIAVKKCSLDIRSIELQLVRVETTVYAEGEVREATEIQNIQIADGNICRDVSVPIYMMFPRLFTCITTITKAFKVEFEANMIVLFSDGHMVTENFPIKLIRQ